MEVRRPAFLRNGYCERIVRELQMKPYLTKVLWFVIVVIPARRSRPEDRHAGPQAAAISAGAPPLRRYLPAVLRGAVAASRGSAHREASTGKKRRTSLHFQNRPRALSRIAPFRITTLIDNLPAP